MTISTDPHRRPVTLDVSGQTSPHPFYEYMRRTEPVWHGTLIDQSLLPAELVPDDAWVLFGYDDVLHALRDDQVFSSYAYDQTLGLVLGHTMLAMGGKEHYDHRNLVSKAFRARTLARWEASIIRPVCTQLVDEIKNDGAADLVKAVAFEFPTRIFATLLGLPPEDLDLFRRWSFDLLSIWDDIEAGLRASIELRDYFADQIEQRRRKLTDDIIGDLVSAEIDGEKLNDEAIISFLRMLLPAGHETTYRASGNLLYLLLTHPEQLAMVYRDRTLIPAAIEESLRYEAPLPTIARTTTRDVDMGGKTIPSGAQIGLCIGSANHDESRWTDPDVFDINRAPQAHLTFAGGNPHVPGRASCPAGNASHVGQLVRPRRELGAGAGRRLRNRRAHVPLTQQAAGHVHSGVMKAGSPSRSASSPGSSRRSGSSSRRATARIVVRLGSLVVTRCARHGHTCRARAPDH